MTIRFLTRKTMILAAMVALSCVASADEKKPAPPGGEKKPEAPVADAAKDAAKKAGQDAMPGGMDAEAMKKMMEAGMPGPHHKHLAQLVGKWNCKTEWSMAPDAPASTSEGKAEFKFILDGRYLQQEFSAPGMEPNFPPMSGIGLTGYNNAAKRYEAIWIDNGSTGMAMMTGACAADGKTFTYNGEYADPMADGKVKKFRAVCKVVDNDTHTFEFFEPGPDGKEFRSMLITYARAK